MKDSIVLNKSKAKNMAKNNLVVKSNQVVEASYALTTLEQRLILSVIAQIPKGQEVSDDVLYPISIETVGQAWRRCQYFLHQHKRSPKPPV